MRARTLAALAGLAAVLAPPLLAETWEQFYLGETGVVIGSLTIEYSTDGAADTLPGGVSLVEIGSGFYALTGLPDVTAGSGTTHGVSVLYGAFAHSYLWPRSAVTASATTAAPLAVHLPSGARALEIRKGDTLPQPVAIVGGLASDPTGATAVGLMTTSAGGSVSLAGSAVVENIEALSDGTWRLRCRFVWDAADTTALTSNSTYGFRFVVTLPGGEVLTAPPSPRVLNVTVYP